MSQNVPYIRKPRNNKGGISLMSTTAPDLVIEGLGWRTIGSKSQNHSLFNNPKYRERSSFGPQYIFWYMRAIIWNFYCPILGRESKIYFSIHESISSSLNSNISKMPTLVNQFSSIFSHGYNPYIIIGLIVTAVAFVLWKECSIRLDPREPPLLRPTIPYYGHTIGLLRYHTEYYNQL